MRLAKLPKRELLGIQPFRSKRVKRCTTSCKRTRVSSSGGQLDDIPLSMLLVRPVLGNPPNATCLAVMESVPVHVSL